MSMKFKPSLIINEGGRMYTILLESEKDTSECIVMLLFLKQDANPLAYSKSMRGLFVLDVPEEIIACTILITEDMPVKIITGRFIEMAELRNRRLFGIDMSESTQFITTFTDEEWKDMTDE